MIRGDQKQVNKRLNRFEEGNTYICSSLGLLLGNIRRAVILGGIELPFGQCHPRNRFREDEARVTGVVAARLLVRVGRITERRVGDEPEGRGGELVSHHAIGGEGGGRARVDCRSSIWFTQVVALVARTVAEEAGNVLGRGIIGISSVV